MKNVFFIFLFLFGYCLSGFSQTYYYKLTKKSVNNVVSTNVSGGQFITFMANICYESTAKGFNVGHGKLTRNSVNSEYKTYKGSSYWGTATFRFKADLSKLNVITDNGDVWVYTRTTAPASATTCSLIRKSGSGSHSSTNDNYNTLPPAGSNNTVIINNTYNNGGSSSTDGNNKRMKEHTYYEVCSTCHGTGYSQGYTSTPYYGGVRVKEYCPVCKRRVYPHTHKACSRCHGTGQVKRTSYSYE